MGSLHEFQTRYKALCEEERLDPQAAIASGDDALRLCVTHAALGENQAELLGRALREAGDFEEVELGDTFIKDAGATALCAALPRQPHLHTLILRGNNIGLEGTNAVAALLTETVPALRTLSLEWNHVGHLDESVSVLANSLRANSTLKTLDLRNNRITPEGARILADSLAVNCTLTSLDLRWNSIGGHGASKLSQCLDNNVTLSHLDLMGNEVDFATMELIREKLSDNMRNRDIEERKTHVEQQIVQVKGETVQQYEQMLSEKEDALRAELNTIRIQYDNSIATKREAEIRLEGMGEQVLVLQKQLASVQGGLEAEVREREGREGELERAKEDCATSESKIRELQDKNHKLELALEEADLKRELEVEKEKRRWAAEVEKSKQAEEEAKQAAGDAKSRQMGLSDDMEALKRRQREGEASHRGVRDELEEARQRLHGIEDELQAAHNKYTQLESAKASQERHQADRIRKLESELAIKAKEYMVLEQKRDALESEINEANRSIQDSTDQLRVQRAEHEEGLTRMRNNFSKERQDLNSVHARELKEREEQVKSREAELQAIQQASDESVKKYLGMLQDRDEQVRKLDERVGELQLEAHKAQASMRDRESQWQIHERQLAEAQRQRSQISLQLEEQAKLHQQKIENLNEEVREKEGKISAMDTSHSDLLARMRQNEERFRSWGDDLRRKSERLEHRIHDSLRTAFADFATLSLQVPVAGGGVLPAATLAEAL